MAIATAFHHINMDAATTWYGDVTIATASRIQVASGGYVQNYYGSFTYDLYGLSGGTVNATDYSEFGNKIYEISGGAYNALTVESYIDSGNTVGLFGYIFSGNDRLNGSPEDDVINAFSGSDQVSGAGGNDVLKGGTGNDTLDGGAGIDTASYSGYRASYTVQRTLTGWSVEAAEGNDSLTGIEKLQFADMALDLGQLNRLYEYYIAYYGRPGATPGIEYWLNALNTSMQGDESQLVWNFGNSVQPEFARLYDTGGSIESFVSSVFANLFNRAPAQAGIDYWTSTYHLFKNQGLDDDAIRGKMVTWIMDGARDVGASLDRTTLDNKVLAASAFTAALDTPQELDGYRDPQNTAALDYARDWLREVTSDPATVASHTDPATIDQAIIELVGVYGA